MKDHGERVEFHCPRCQGTCWSTYDPDYFEKGDRTMSTATGHCHGPDTGWGCNFSWKRSEDWKVFYVVHVKSFESKEEYEADGR